MRQSHGFKYNRAMMITSPNELDTIIADAASSEGKPPADRMAMFFGLLAVVDAIWMNLTPQERRRRQEIGEHLHQRPDPWWKFMRRQELERTLCSDSSE